MDDSRRGGDIDLLIETEMRDGEEAMLAEIAFLVEVKSQIGEQKTDVLVDYPGRRERPEILRVTRDTGVTL